MATGTFYPAASGDDGYYYGANFNSAGVNFYIGKPSASDSSNAWIRFLNVTIPQGSTITAAFVRLSARHSSSTTTVNANVYFNNVDDAVAPTSIGEVDALALTSAIAWNNLASWTVVNDYDTPSLTSILQSVVNRGGWGSGQALQVVIKDNGSSASANRSASSFDFSSGSYKAELHVTWTAPITGEISENINVSSEFDDSFGEIDENVSVSSELICYDSFSETDENISVSSELIYLDTDSPISEDASVNSSLIAEHTGNLSEDASVNIAVSVEKYFMGEFSEDVSVNSEFDCHTPPANLDATLPMITADIQGGHGGFMEGTLPCITAELRGGAILEATLPMITAEITGKVGRVGELEVTLPSITASITGKTETLAELEATLPMVRAYITGKIGAVGELNVTLPMITADLQGYHGIAGELEVTLPMVEARLVGTVERDACEVLRFEEPET